MATKLDNKSQVVTSAKQLIAGATKYLTGTTPVVLLGTSVTPAEITAQLQSLVNLRADVDAAKAATKAKIAAEAAASPSLRALRSAFVTYVKAAYGSSPDVLADFGIQPKPRAPLTVEAKAAAVAKRASTRAARHTLGSKQKEEIKGDVTGVVVTPVTASAVAAPAPAPVTVTAPAPVTVTAPAPATTVASATTSPQAPVATPTH
jgi:hypothetical protein